MLCTNRFKKNILYYYTTKYKYVKIIPHNMFLIFLVIGMMLTITQEKNDLVCISYQLCNYV